MNAITPIRHHLLTALEVAVPMRSLLVAAVLVLSACTSTQERFDTAADLMAERRYSAAADEYVRILESDPEFPGARDRLREAGDLAVERFVTDARSAAQAEAFGDASRIVQELDRFLARVEDVDVYLATPDDLSAFREDVHGSAIEAYIAEGDTHLEGGDWRSALRSYDNALQTPGGEAHESLLNDRAGQVHLEWGKYEMDRGTFRSAAEHLSQAIELLRDDEDLDHALLLRDQAFNFGTVWTAFLPLYLTGTAVDAPRGIDRELDDLLLFEYWSHPPPFVGQIDPADQRRVLRREGSGPQPPSTREASEIGRVLDAHYVVVTEFSAFSAQERNVRRSRKEARMTSNRRRAAQDTAYTAVRATLRLEGELSFTLIDTDERRVVDRTQISGSASGAIEWGEFAGDPEDLNLTSRDRELFDPEVLQAARREVEDQLIDQLAERYADRIFDRIVGRIP